MIRSTRHMTSELRSVLRDRDGALKRALRGVLGRARRESRRSAEHLRAYLVPMFARGSESGRSRLAGWFAHLHLLLVLCVAIGQLGSQGVQLSTWLSSAGDAATPAIEELAPVRRLARPSAGDRLATPHGIKAPAAAESGSAGGGDVGARWSAVRFLRRPVLTNLLAQPAQRRHAAIRRGALRRDPGPTRSDVLP